MPVDDGDPPVVMASVPGKESDGREDVVFVYSVPRATNAASVELGLAAIYLSRSSWWKPSMLSSSTCAALPLAALSALASGSNPPRLTSKKQDAATTRPFLIVMSHLLIVVRFSRHVK